VEQEVQPATEVPFVELGRDVHRPLRANLLAALGELLDTGAFTNGPQVARFETAFASFVGSTFCVGTSSGLDALRLGLIAAGLQGGEEVIVPANTFVATLAAVVQAGGVPVPVDVSELDYNIDVDAIEAALTPRTRFLLPVHMYGQMADMCRVTDVATSFGRDLLVLEDASQAHGASRDGVRAGTSGVAGAFSFYPSKNLGAIGDAGAIVTDDRRIADATRVLREHGQAGKNDFVLTGYTARLDTVQAIVLSQKLAHLERWNEQRARAAAYYNERLADLADLGRPPIAHASRPSWHLYAARVPDATKLARFLARRGIRTGRHYPVPAHLTPAYEWLGYGPGSFPVAERLARELLSLPLFPSITTSQIDLVVDAVSDFFSEASSRPIAASAARPSTRTSLGGCD
jgi:dTDP-3-amino-3,4,6-trideoxy-alpha-D-glucose transaminase